MTVPFVMPPRQPDDGDLRVERIDEHHLAIVMLSTDGMPAQRLVVSDFNAARVLATLTLFLGVRLKGRDASRLTLW